MANIKQITKKKKKSQIYIGRPLNGTNSDHQSLKFREIFKTYPS